MAAKKWTALLAGVTALTGGLIYGEEKLYRNVLKPREDPEEADRAHEGVKEGRLYVREHKDKEDLYLRAVDDLTLYAAYLGAAKADCHTYVILVHGISDTHERVGIYAKKYHASGYPVLMPDLRGYGRSEGDYIGYGYDDRLDLMEWIYYLIRMDSEAQIILHGISMGAAAVLMTSGEKLPAQVKAVIADSAYASLREEMETVYRRTGASYIPAKTAVASVRKMIQVRAGYDIEDVDCVAAVKRSVTPTLFLHGEADVLVPVKMCRTLYDATACPKKMKTFFGSAHVDAVSREPELYWETVDRFLSEYL